MSLSEDFLKTQNNLTSLKNTLASFNAKNSQELKALIRRYAEIEDMFLNDGRSGLSGIVEIQGDYFKVIAYGWEADSSHTFPLALILDPQFMINLELKHQKRLNKRKQENTKRELETLARLEKKYRRT